MGAALNFADLSSERQLIAAPGAYDALSARIAVLNGAQAIYLGGNAVGLGLGKAQPFVTLSDTLDVASRVKRAVDQPIVADLGAGFGDRSHIRVAVREAEALGLAAIHIDDQPYPKPVDYHRGVGRVVEVSVAVDRIAAAVQSRRSRGMAVIARTDALRVSGDLAQTIERGAALAQAGADALMILDLSPNDAVIVRSRLPQTPLVWIGGVSAPIPSLDELRAAGFCLALYPFNAVAAVTTSLNDLWSGFYANGRPGQDADLLAKARAETVQAADLPAAWALEDGQ